MGESVNLNSLVPVRNLIESVLGISNTPATSPLIFVTNVVPSVGVVTLETNVAVASDNEPLIWLPAFSSPWILTKCKILPDALFSTKATTAVPFEVANV